jgi:surfeit locus 1 family protein
MLKIRFWPALAVLVVALLTTSLGFWQRGRAHEKEARQARIEQFAQAPAIELTAQGLPLKSAEYRRIVVHGHFLPELTVYLDNRPYQDQPGFYVVTPLQLDTGGAILVNRGWLPRNSVDRTVIAPYRTPTGAVQLTGLVRADATRVFELGHGGSAPHLKIRQNLAVDAYASETGLLLRPFVLEQTSDDGDGLVRDWPAPSSGVERNYGYMLQWWGMAIAVIVFGFYAAFRAARAQRLHEPD